MGKFLNDLKKAFTTPKTRHMQKKIDSMKDYMGFTKKLFEQMEQDAIFFKTCEETFNRAAYGLTEPASPKWTYQLLTQHATNGNYFNDLHAHKINWYKIGDRELSEFETKTNNEIINQQATYENPERTCNLKKLLDDINPKKAKSYNAYSIPPQSLQEYMKISENYRDFCRKIKKEIKKLFEKKQKEFETQRKNEKVYLQLLQKHQQNLETQLNKKDFKTALQTWTTIQNYYEQNNAATKQLTNTTYQIAKQTIQNHIKTRIETLCDNIKITLTSYVNDNKYKNTNQLERADKEKLRKLTEEFNTLISDCLTAEEHTLNTIGTSPENLNKILEHITAATSKFLDPTNKTPINEIEFSCALKSINSILKE